MVVFNDYSDNVAEDLAILLGKVSHHIHPEIIKKIELDNKEFREEFTLVGHPNLEIDDYFYGNSDCVFPGVRRPINKEIYGIKNWKNKIFEEDGTILNDNTYPRHLWSFLAMSKPYTGGARGSWNNSGLNKFELAHIFSHKTDEIILERRVFEKIDSKRRPYALFTSASNVVLIPKGFTKPTDKMDSIKLCFYQRHFELYGDNLGSFINFDQKKVPKWYKNISWLNPILPDNWENKIEKLLSYRKKHLIEKYKCG